MTSDGRWPAASCGRLGDLCRVLENALGAGVVNELAARHEALLHGHLAPGAEPIGNIARRRRCGGRSIGLLIRHDRHSRQGRETLSMSRSWKKWTAFQAFSIVRFMHRPTNIHHRKDAHPHAQRRQRHLRRHLIIPRQALPTHDSAFGRIRESLGTTYLC
jgi:hypothetical protein